MSEADPSTGEPAPSARPYAVSAIIGGIGLLLSALAAFTGDHALATKFVSVEAHSLVVLGVVAMLGVGGLLCGWLWLPRAGTDRETWTVALIVAGTLFVLLASSAMDVGHRLWEETCLASRVEALRARDEAFHVPANPAGAAPAVFEEVGLGGATYVDRYGRAIVIYLTDVGALGNDVGLLVTRGAPLATAGEQVAGDLTLLRETSVPGVYWVAGP